MNKVFAVLSLVAVAAVSAAPFDLVHHAAVALFHPVGVVDGDHKLRFLHLMPKAAHSDAFGEGFGCKGKHHAFLKLDAGHKLVELVGLADCATWHAVHLTVWTAAGALEHKVHAFAKAAGATTFADAGVADLAALVTFVHGKLDAHKALFGKLVASGVPAHVLVLKLHKALGL